MGMGDMMPGMGGMFGGMGGGMGYGGYGYGDPAPSHTDLADMVREKGGGGGERGRETDRETGGAERE